MIYRALVDAGVKATFTYVFNDFGFPINRIPYRAYKIIFVFFGGSAGKAPYSGTRIYQLCRLFYERFPKSAYRCLVCTQNLFSRGICTMRANLIRQLPKRWIMRKKFSIFISG